jgi:hypothetical protein
MTALLDIIANIFRLILQILNLVLGTNLSLSTGVAV